MNVLIPILRAGGVFSDGGLQYDVSAVITSLVVPAERARIGTVALLSYSSEVWERFAASATDLAARPDRTLAIAAFRASERWVVVPAPEREATSIALWSVREDNTLDVVTRDLPEDAPAEVMSTLRTVLDRGDRHLLKQSPDTYDCGNHASKLSCQVRHCPKGDCVPESWFDPKYNMPLYGCTCVSR